MSQSPHLPYAHVSNMREVVSLVCTGEMQLDFSVSEHSSLAGSGSGSSNGANRTGNGGPGGVSGSGCSARLAAVLTQCLAVTPSKRPTMSDMVGHIEQIMRESYGTPRSPQPQPQQPPSHFDSTPTPACAAAPLASAAASCLSHGPPLLYNTTV